MRTQDIELSGKKCKRLKCRRLAIWGKQLCKKHHTERIQLANEKGIKYWEIRDGNKCNQ